jgi:hypothetical protein
MQPLPNGQLSWKPSFSSSNINFKLGMPAARCPVVQSAAHEETMQIYRRHVEDRNRISNFFPDSIPRKQGQGVWVLDQSSPSHVPVPTSVRRQATAESHGIPRSEKRTAPSCPASVPHGQKLPTAYRSYQSQHGRARPCINTLIVRISGWRAYGARLHPRSSPAPFQYLFDL